MRLVKDRVLYVWQQLTSDIKLRAADSQRRLKGIQQKLDRLDEAYLFAQTIDLTSYERQRDNAWRAIWKSPTTSIGAMLALALGIGATTTIFGLLNAVLLRPRSPVWCRHSSTQCTRSTGCRSPAPVDGHGRAHRNPGACA